MRQRRPTGFDVLPHQVRLGNHCDIMGQKVSYILLKHLAVRQRRPAAFDVLPHQVTVQLTRNQYCFLAVPCRACGCLQNGRGVVSGATRDDSKPHFAVLR